MPLLKKISHVLGRDKKEAKIKDIVISESKLQFRPLSELAGKNVVIGVPFSP